MHPAYCGYNDEESTPEFGAGLHELKENFDATVSIPDCTSMTYARFSRSLKKQLDDFCSAVLIVGSE